MRVYIASPLHGSYERQVVMIVAQAFRSAGINAYVPHEHGVWEQMVREQLVKTPNASRDEVIRAVKLELYKGDMHGLRTSDCVVAIGAHLDGSPSEGMIWEMGFARGANKPVYLINPVIDKSFQSEIGEYDKDRWAYNIMPLFGSDMVFETLTECVKYITAQSCGIK